MGEKLVRAFTDPSWLGFWDWDFLQELQRQRKREKARELSLLFFCCSSHYD